MKKGLLILWFVLALGAFFGGLVIMIDNPSIQSYLSWGGMCAMVCVFHLIYDFVAGNRSGCLLYMILSVVLGPLIILLFMFYTLTEIISG